jgi:hypothetical protein
VAEDLVIIIGAGASHDCAVMRRGDGKSPYTLRDPDGDWRPPLTRSLFEPRATFAPILDDYPAAQAAAADIRALIDTAAPPDQAFALERYLRETLKESNSEDDRYRFRQIPLYLQHLLHEVSRQYTTDPENYHRLVNAALRSGLKNVTFITLNYDTILDRLLFQRTLRGTLSGNPEDMSDYVRKDRRWALFKLHGSVNWVRRVLTPIDELPLPREFDPGPVFTGWFAATESQIDEDQLDPTIELRVTDHVYELRFVGNRLYYPALSVPIGPDTQLLNCPKFHLDALRERLRRMGNTICVLVVGFSGLDVEVIDLLAEEGRSIRKLSINDPDPETIHGRFSDHRIVVTEPEYLPGRFAKWAQSGNSTPTSRGSQSCRRTPGGGPLDASTETPAGTLVAREAVARNGCNDYAGPHHLEVVGPDVRRAPRVLLAL